ncbi:RelA/SpoT domain-containing protein [Breznakiella homolactica]|uniref:Tetratricopeptide repeat protein n=1 Tax=Breznakiella homolactica TaxID=2798577 RepID=A0A7T8B9Y1_9SPIR|nr:RelA/SpoT domain-containing protein [Breznakiella homolactica]QQO08405.1 tetratricopeptide repeat protein [Breznakiella homolactica]
MQKNNPLPDRNELKKKYERYSEVRSLITRDLQIRLEEIFQSFPTHPTIKSRTKNFESYFRKYLRILKENGKNGEPPLITDLIAVRIVCPFIEDLSAAEQTIKRTLEVIEVERKGSNHTFKEFGYESTHLLIKIPGDILEERGGCDSEVAEVQIRTILQDAWAEVEHELVYKAEFTPFDEPMKRKLAAVNASLSLADIIFQEIRDYQRQLNSQLGKRRDSFFKKIEDSTDGLLFSAQETPGKPEQAEAPLPYATPSGGESIDDLLLNALYAHNKNQFDEAIGYYTRILDADPDNTIKSLIYKHRGMANFAQSKYEEAIDDFSQSFSLDPKSYKVLYYRGVVRSVLQDYSEAINDFTESLRINPYQPFSLYRRGQAYFHIEDYPGALADAEAALVLEPDSESIKKFRAMVLEKLKM